MYDAQYNLKGGFKKKSSFKVYYVLYNDVLLSFTKYLLKAERKK